MIIEHYHIISIQIRFVIKHRQQSKRDRTNPIDDENHWHWLLNPMRRKRFRYLSL
jgi:hypothetical protein